MLRTRYSIMHDRSRELAKEASELTLVFEASDATIVRRIPAARPVDPKGERAHGDAVEHATLRSSVDWGLPDFVYPGMTRRKGQGTREIGDVVLVTGGLGAVVQVKSRRPGDAHTTGEREARWLNKRLSKARSQARGTLRTLRGSEFASMVNLRGHEIELHVADTSWVSVIIVDHPSPPEFTPDGTDCLVILRSEWDFLFDQLKSTYALLSYLHRVATEPPVMLGHEVARYHLLADADERAEPSKPDVDLLPNGNHVSAPLLPFETCGSRDPQALAFFRRVLEQVATSPIEDPSDRDLLMRSLETLDRIPVAFREEWARTWITWLEQARHDSSLRFNARRVFDPRDASRLTVIAVSTGGHGLQDDGFRAYTFVCHLELQESVDEASEPTTVGVMLVPLNRAGGFRSTLICMIGRFDVDPDDREIMREAWTAGAFGSGTGRGSGR